MTQKKKSIFTKKYTEHIVAHLKNAYTILWEKRTFKDMIENSEDTSNTKGKKIRNTEQKMLILGDCILLVLIYGLMFHAINLGSLLKDTVPIGGDIPYHFANYIDLKEIFLPHGEIAGWSDASYAGYNIFQSYPVFGFLLIYLLNIFIGSGVAFKIVLLFGAIGLPLVIYWALIQIKIPRPGPIFGSVLSLAFLFQDDSYAFGGNLRSVLTGEFSYSLGLLFLVLFCAFLFKSFENKKYSTLTALSLAIIGFTHPIPFAVAFFLPLFFLLDYSKTVQGKGGFFSKSRIAIKIMLIAGLLFSTWAIGYTVIQNYGGLRISTILSHSYGGANISTYLVPKLFYPLALFFLSIVVYSIFYLKKLSISQALFLWGFLVSTVFFLLRFHGFAARFLPLIYLFLILFICATIGLWYQNTQKIKIRIFIYLMLIVSLFGIFGYIKINALFETYQGTSGYIFEGAQGGWEWNSMRQVSEFLSKNFDTQTEKQQTELYPPRVLSLNKGDFLRAKSHASLYDSLFSKSFFRTQGKLTIRQIKEKKISPQKIWSYMELSNTKIIVATPDIAKYLKNTPYFLSIKSFGTYEILQTNKTSKAYVVPLLSPVYAIGDIEEWLKMSQKWYRNYLQKLSSAQSVPFFVYDPLGEEPIFMKYDTNKIINKPARKNCKVQEFIQRKEIHIETDCIGRPLLIKFAYHPNWQVIGAKKIYLSTPAFMIIIPEQKNVTLFYGEKPYNYLSYLCGILGIILLFSYSFVENYIIFLSRKIYIKYNKVFTMLKFTAKKIQLPKIGAFLGENSTTILFIIILIISIAYLQAG